MGQDNTTRPGHGSVAETPPKIEERESDLPTVSGRVPKAKAPASSASLPPPHSGPEPGEHSVPARSGRKSKVPTQRGISRSKPPKVVTKHGLAPPPPTSSPPPPPPDDPDFEPERIPLASKVPDFDLAQADAWEPDHSAIEAARNELTPTATEISEFEEDAGNEGEDPRRALFQTNRGGGKNRVSGGRSAASAYVSPSTLAPGQDAAHHHTAAVKIHESVRSEAYRYATEPSLLRRRQSSLPVIPMRRRISVAWVLALSLLAGFGTGLAALWIHKSKSEPPAPVITKKIEDSRNAPTERPKQAPESASLRSTDTLAEQASEPAPAEYQPSGEPTQATEPAPRQLSNATDSQSAPSTIHSQAERTTAQKAAPRAPLPEARPQPQSRPLGPAPQKTPATKAKSTTYQSDTSSDELWLE